MLNYAQKTPLIIYSTSQVKNFKFYRIYNYIIVFVCGLQVELCKRFKCSKFCFKTFFPFLRGKKKKKPNKKTKKLYTLMWIPPETRTNFNKTKILNKYFAQSTWATVDGPRFNLGFES